MIKIKAQERKLMVGPKAGTYMYQMTPETYSTLTEEKVIEEASLRSGYPKGCTQGGLRRHRTYHQGMGNGGTLGCGAGTRYDAIRGELQGRGGREHGGFEPHHHPKDYLHPVGRREEGAQGGCHQHHLLRPQRKRGEACELRRLGRD